MRLNGTGRIKPCAGEGCKRLIRPSNWKAKDFPGTVVHAGHGLCSTCVSLRRREAGYVPPPQGMAQRPSVEENLASLEAYFASRRSFRIALGQTIFPPWNQVLAGSASHPQRKVRVRRMTKLKPCGTEAAYQRHVTYKEPVDDACKEEHARYRQAGRERKNAKGQS